MPNAIIKRTFFGGKCSFSARMATKNSTEDVDSGGCDAVSHNI